MRKALRGQMGGMEKQRQHRLVDSKSPTSYSLYTERYTEEGLS